MGLKNIMPTIMIGKMDIELPAIHIMKKFIGICFRGPKAMSHDLYRKKKRIKAITQQQYWFPKPLFYHLLILNLLIIAQFINYWFWTSWYLLFRLIMIVLSIKFYTYSGLVDTCLIYHLIILGLMIIAVTSSYSSLTCSYLLCESLTNWRLPCLSVTLYWLVDTCTWLAYQLLILDLLIHCTCLVYQLLILDLLIPAMSNSELDLLIPALPISY